MGVDKVLADIDGLPVVAATVATLAAAGIRRIWVGVRPEAEAAVRGALLGVVDGVHVRLIIGGVTRRETVARCLTVLPPDVEYVVVHDAARPFCSPELVRRVCAAASDSGAACAALPLVDTVHCAAADGSIASTPERSRLWRAQTPQAFRRDLLAQAHAGTEGSETDDAGLCAAAGCRVQLIEGERSNLKLTFVDDLTVSTPVAVGQGLDVHRLVEGRRLVLGGVEIPHERGLDGHSDADVLCHALCDAVLGAAGLGDIGVHFPPDDARYKGANSLGLVSQCAQLVRATGWRPAQADCLVVAEEPRLGPHVREMRRNLAQALRVGEQRVNVKAGTNEGLGWIGRREGIAAHAVVTLVRLPLSDGCGVGAPAATGGG